MGIAVDHLTVFRAGHSPVTLRDVKANAVITLHSILKHYRVLLVGECDGILEADCLQSIELLFIQVHQVLVIFGRIHLSQLGHRDRRHVGRDVCIALFSLNRHRLRLDRIAGGKLRSCFTGVLIRHGCKDPNLVINQVLAHAVTYSHRNRHRGIVRHGVSLAVHHRPKGGCGAQLIDEVIARTEDLARFIPQNGEVVSGRYTHRAGDIL